MPIPGDHVTLIRDPRNVEALAGRLREAIERGLGIAPKRAGASLLSPRRDIF